MHFKRIGRDKTGLYWIGQVVCLVFGTTRIGQNRVDKLPLKCCLMILYGGYRLTGGSGLMEEEVVGCGVGRGRGGGGGWPTVVVDDMKMVDHGWL